MTDQMMADRITSHLDEESRKSYRICVMDEVTSTNTVLKQMASDGAPTGTVITQTPVAGTPITSSINSVDLYISS